MNRFEFINWLEDVRQGTRRLISIIPEDACDFRLTDESLTIREMSHSFSLLEEQFVRGVCTNDWSDPGNPADARRQLTSALSEETDDYGLSDDVPDDFDSCGEIIDHLDNIHQEALDILAELTDEEFQTRKVVVPWGEEATIQRLLIGMVEREVHNRSELYIALKIYGVPVTDMIIFGP